jgi:hypothetical protein
VKGPLVCRVYWPVTSQIAAELLEDSWKLVKDRRPDGRRKIPSQKVCELGWLIAPTW